MPCYNEERTLSTVLGDLIKKRSEFSHEFNLIIGVFDDGSSDSSNIIASNFPVFIHRNKRNIGLGGVFSIIVNHARRMKVDYLITVDADAQFNIEDLDTFLNLIKNSEPDLILGSRFLNISKAFGSVPLIKLIGNLIGSILLFLSTGRMVRDSTCGFRSYSKNAIFLLNPSEKFTYTMQSLSQLLTENISISEIPISVKYFVERNSAITGSKIRYSIRTLKILFRIMISISLRRMAGYLTILIPIGSLLLNLFFIKSSENGSFYGYLYLGLAGAFILLVGFISLNIYFLSYKMDSVLLRYNSLMSDYFDVQDSNCANCFNFRERKV